MHALQSMAAAILFGWATWSGAAPAPFGLEIGKSTIQEARERYRLERSGTNKYTLGPMYRMDPAQVEFDGLQRILLIYWPDGRLASMILEMEKHRFDEVVDMLAEKYRLVSRNRPLVGNASAELRDGDTMILVDAPHLSFTMTVIYSAEAMFKKFNEVQREEKARKKKKESGQL